MCEREREGEKERERERAEKEKSFAKDHLSAWHIGEMAWEINLAI